MKNANKWKKVMLITGFLLFLVACQVTDSTGAIIPGKEINASSAWFDLSKGIFHGAFVLPLGKLLLLFDSIVGMTGAILIVTIITRIITLPITRKSTEASILMQEIQPELDEIKEKYRGRTDPAAAKQQLADQQMVYRKYNYNPMISLVGGFISFPVLVGMFYAVQATEKVAQSTIFGVSFASTISKGIKNFDIGCIVIFVTMLAAQYLSIYITQYLNDKRKTKHQKQQQKPAPGMGKGMAIMMTAMMGMFGYNMAVALNIYWLTGSIVGIIQTIFVHQSNENKKKRKAVAKHA